MTNDRGISGLYDPDPALRRVAIHELACQEPSRQDRGERLEALARALSDPHIAVQEAAADLLLTFPPPLVAEYVLPLLNGTVQLRSIVIDLIQQLGPPVVPSLLESLNHPDPHIRKFLTDILGHIGCPGSVSGLIALMKDDCSNVRAAAAEALGKVGGESAVRGLVGGLDDPEEWVRFSAIHALGELRAQKASSLLCPLLESSDMAVQCAVVEALGKIGDHAVLPDLLAILPLAGLPLRHHLFVTIAALVGEHSDVFQRPETREFLSAELMAALESRETEIQLAALKGIRLMGDSTATGALLEYLRKNDSTDHIIHSAVTQALSEMGDEAQLMETALNGEESVALRCIEALSECHATRAIPLFGQLVSHSENREVRRAALRALRQFEGIPCSDIVIQAVNDPSGYVRAEAIRVIVHAGLFAARGVLVARLEEEHYPDVMEELVRALLILTKHADLTLVQQLFRHTNVEVRANVATLWSHEDPTVMKRVLLAHVWDVEWKVRLAIVERLTLFDPDPELGELMFQVSSDAHPYLRQAGVTALSKYSRDRVTATLYQMLRHDQDMWVRVRCVEQLVALGDVNAAPLFLTLLPEAPPPVQMMMAEALGNYQYQPAIEVLNTLLSNDVEDVRDAARTALECLQLSSDQVGAQV